ncbi:MAG: MalY/PatB family protein [Bacillota bacterium]
MKYNFDNVIDRRNTDSMKWRKGAYPREDVLPFSAADMDFEAPWPVVEALKDRAAHSIYGYGFKSESLVSSVIDRMGRKYGWKVPREWVRFTPGVMPGVQASLRAVTKPGDSVLVQSPVYAPFFHTIEQAGCKVTNSRLRFNGEQYQIDFEDLERKFDEQHPAAMILCSPHNPIGRVWTKEELTRIGRIALRYGAKVISDEIHGEVIYEGHRHFPYSSLSPEVEAQSIVCTSPGKTFSMTGIVASVAIIPDKNLRDRFDAAAGHLMGGVNIFGLLAMEAAYRHGDEWLEQVLDYLESNRNYLLRFFDEKIPRIKAVRPEGSFLAWLDCTGLSMGPKELQSFFADKAGVGLVPGASYGPGGETFMRFNFAYPRSILEEGLRRVAAAVDALK